jgi:hypothetical protein
MTVVTPPTIVPRSGQPPEDDLDGLLRAYFQAEMPDPWPSFEAPVPRNGVLPLRRPKASRFAPWRSRLALAASILLLIAAALFLLSGSWSTDGPAKTDLLPSAQKDPLPSAPPPNDPSILVGPDGSRIEIQIDMPMK